MRCEVCTAPALPLEGACVFCHSPLPYEGDAYELMDYLVERLPAAKIKRGMMNRGPITELVMDVGDRHFRARWLKDQLILEPAVELTAWLDLLLSHLSDAAAVDANLRRMITRSGWALR